MSLLLRNQLKALAALKPGQTLNLKWKDGLLLAEVVAHGSWLTAVSRYCAGDSRKRTVKYIENLFLTALRHPEFRDLVEAALTGLDNLKLTYAEDAATVARLCAVQRNTRLKLSPPQGKVSFPTRDAKPAASSGGELFGAVSAGYFTLTRTLSLVQTGMKVMSYVSLLQTGVRVATFAFGLM